MEGERLGSEVAARTFEELATLVLKIEADFKKQYGKPIKRFHVVQAASDVFNEKISAYLRQRLEHLPLNDLIQLLHLLYNEVGMEEGGLEMAPADEQVEIVPNRPPLSPVDKQMEKKRRGRPKKLG